MNSKTKHKKMYWIVGSARGWPKLESSAAKLGRGKGADYSSSVMQVHSIQNSTYCLNIKLGLNTIYYCKRVHLVVMMQFGQHSNLVFYLLTQEFIVMAFTYSRIYFLFVKCSL